MAHQVLALDQCGLPYQWIGLEDAVFYYAKDLVLYELGDKITTFHGGKSRLTGIQSQITPSSIIAIKGCTRGSWLLGKVPTLCNETLFERDRKICAYCGHQFRERDLSRDHVKPQSKNGPDVWENVVTSCRVCNNKKADKTPEEAGMQLLYVPYRPNRYEHFILSNRNILTDQMDYLLPNVSRESRLLVKH